MHISYMFILEVLNSIKSSGQTSGTLNSIALLTSIPPNWSLTIRYNLCSIQLTTILCLISTRILQPLQHVCQLFQETDIIISGFPVKALNTTLSRKSTLKCVLCVIFMIHSTFHDSFKTMFSNISVHVGLILPKK